MLKKTLYRVMVAILFCAAVLFQAGSPAKAKETTCPEHTPVTIDIKPGSDRNPINLSAHGVVPVAVLATPDFAASQFSPEMAHLSAAETAMDEGCSGALAQRWVLDDVNGDGEQDLVFFFRIQDLNLTTSSTAATLMAHGAYGATTLHIMGTDTVTVKP